MVFLPIGPSWRLIPVRSGPGRIVMRVASMFGGVLLVLLSWIGSPGAVRAQTIYDHFDGPALDDRLWDGIPQGANHWLAGSLLHVATPSVQDHAWFSAAQDFRGDIEVILDWQGFQIAGGINADAQVEVSNYPDDDALYYMMRYDGPSGSGIGFFGQVQGVQTGAFWVSSAATAGRFRIVRTGDQIDGYYDTGGGWVLLGSLTGIFTGDAQASIGVSGGMSHVAFDYLEVNGAPVHPMPDIQANGTDGPLTIAAGSPLDLTIAMEPNLFAGQTASEFVGAFRQSGPPFWYTGTGWAPSAAPLSFATGPLATRPATSILNTTTVPPGSYQIYYAVLPATGMMDLRLDSVLLTVQ